MKPTILFSSLLFLASQSFAQNFIVGQEIIYNDSTRSGSFTLSAQNPNPDLEIVHNYESERSYFQKSGMIIEAFMVNDVPIPYMLAGDQVFLYIQSALEWGENSEYSNKNTYPNELTPFDNIYLPEDQAHGSSKALFDYNIELNSFQEYEAETVRADDFNSYIYATDNLGEKFRFKITELNEPDGINFLGACHFTVSWEAETAPNSGKFDNGSPILNSISQQSTQSISIIQNNSILSLTNGEALGSVTLFDSRGRIVFTANVIENSFDLSSLILASGMYSVKIENSTKVVTSKIIFK